MKVRISVTADDITRGRADDCMHCPVALAIGRALLPGVHVAVGPEAMSLGPAQVRVRLPWAAQNFIFRFDGGQPVQPFEFGLDVPDEFVPAEVST